MRPRDYAIIVLTHATAAIHLHIAWVLWQLKGAPDALFTLNGLGYLALAAALYVDIPVLEGRKRLVRYGLAGLAAVTIIAWVFMGERSSLGYATKAVELALIALLLAP